MPTAAFANLGCKVNQYEIEKISDSFVERGFDVTDFNSPADVYLINTCSVTGAADSKSRAMARRAARQNDAARVILTGCFAQMAIDTGLQVDCASLLVANRDKMRAADLTLAAFPELASSPVVCPDSTQIAVFPEQAGLAPSGLQQVRPLALRRTRGTLKVQDGCIHFCAFCSIPYTRNTMASRELPAVLAEARALADDGVQELVVTGVCVGAYRSGPYDLADLLSAVAEIPGIERVRLSSIQPIETGQKLIDSLVAHPEIAPHLHLSLQSGDDSVLHAMGRPYDTGYFRELVARLRQAVPTIGITTDIIVGFPGETEQQFQNTLEFAREMRFARTHVFRYSPRLRTHAAENMRDNVAYADKEDRHRQLSEISRSSQKAFGSQYVGQKVDVLVEARGIHSGWMSGYTGNYVRVQFPCDRSRLGDIVAVQITGMNEDCDGIGELCASPPNPSTGKSDG